MAEADDKAAKAKNPTPDEAAPKLRIKIPRLTTFRRILRFQHTQLERLLNGEMGTKKSKEARGWVDSMARTVEAKHFEERLARLEATAGVDKQGRRRPQTFDQPALTNLPAIGKPS